MLDEGVGGVLEGMLEEGVGEGVGGGCQRRVLEEGVR